MNCSDTGSLLRRKNLSVRIHKDGANVAGAEYFLRTEGAVSQILNTDIIRIR